MEELMARIEKRVIARELAREICVIIASELEGLEEHQVEAFWEQVRESFPQQQKESVEDTVELKPMGDKESQMFGSTHIKFGKYAGERVDEVPLDYLLWLSENKDPWKEQLKRYIKSKRIQSEQQDLE